MFTPLYLLSRSLSGGKPTLMEKAYDFKKGGDHATAIELYTQAIEGGENTWVAHFYRGECLLAVGNTDAAIADFEKAIGLNPKYSGKAKEALNRVKAIKK
jgi:tetratricopeptide (TPR) repeat protein